MNNEKGTIVKSLVKGLSILKHIMNSKTETSIVDLQSALNYNISTIHHQLSTLIAMGFVSQNSKTKKYTIGPELFSYGLLYNESEAYLKRIDPILAESVLKSGETTNLFVNNQEEIVCIRGIESHCLLKANLQIGRRLPLKRAAAGRVFLEPNQDSQFINQKIRYEVEENVLDPSVTAIAVPVVINHEVRFSLCSIMPTSRVLEGTYEKIAENLYQTSLKIAEAFGNQA